MYANRHQHALAIRTVPRRIKNHGHERIASTPETTVCEIATQILFALHISYQRKGIRNNHCFLRIENSKTYYMQLGSSINKPEVWQQ